MFAAQWIDFIVNGILSQFQPMNGLTGIEEVNGQWMDDEWIVWAHLQHNTQYKHTHLLHCPLLCSCSTSNRPSAITDNADPNSLSLSLPLLNSHPQLTMQYTLHTTPLDCPVSSGAPCTARQPVECHIRGEEAAGATHRAAPVRHGASLTLHREPRDIRATLSSFSLSKRGCAVKIEEAALRNECPPLCRPTGAATRTRETCLFVWIQNQTWI